MLTFVRQTNFNQCWLTTYRKPNSLFLHPGCREPDVCLLDFKMADGGFDPCECIFSHEQAMQRLISLLRNTQSQCTDNECFNDGTGMPGASSNGGEYNFFMLMIGWMVIAITLYFMRPSGWRNRGDSKPSNNQGPSSPPPGSSLF